ncbi:39S ribosomal protein L17, mitochondrial [Culex quinquefasciatus]|uniref:Large ribosomal subunit protein bL17m n=1 Tax=Culex quinquefasciatus TaxID=7176 RepID=B0WQN7_CULQU|nr:39S ribosomal protein L17, mitochondrial [Culex quinquefasciatus]|eukprot:XP_001851021.1 39S ribosomal protein L17, mitochondrial [Culex quinquefasciatus]
MNQAEVAKLMSQLRIAIRPRHRNIKNVDGPEGRLDKLRKTVTALVKHERIELNYQRADEARGYAERLISDAIRYGDCHKPTMEMADYWLVEKQLVHKLFKVLAPRFEDCKVSATRMYKAPKDYPGWYRKRAVLELRGNPYPPLVQNLAQNRSLLHNVLLDEARKDFRKEKYAEIAAQIGQDASNSVGSGGEAVAGK